MKLQNGIMDILRQHDVFGKQCTDGLLTEDAFRQVLLDAIEYSIIMIWNRIREYSYRKSIYIIHYIIIIN